MKTNFVFLFVFLFALGSSAQEHVDDPCGPKIDSLTKELDVAKRKVRELQMNVKTKSLGKKIKSCALIGPADNHCKTSKGFEFVRVKDGWKDLASGKTWFTKIYLATTQQSAVATCENKGQKLPTGWPADLNGRSGFPNYDSDMVVAEKHGIHELLFPKNGKAYWSENWIRHGFDGEVGAYALSADTGGLVFLPNILEKHSAICVNF